MDAEERQRTMDFILQQQAKFSSDIDKSEARIGRLERTLKLAIRAGLRERRDWREKYAALIDAQIRNEDAMHELRGTSQEAQIRHENALRELREAARRNTAEINRLEKIMERNATRRNGDDAGRDSDKGE